MLPHQRIREILLGAARELNPSPSWPVDMQAIVQLVGLELQITRYVDKPLAAHLVIRDRPAIVINAKTSEDPFRNNFHRFSIAHEIGHWVVWRRLGLMPSSDSEYWQHERLCNEFAANLLLPIDILSMYVNKLRRRAVHPVHFPRSVATMGEVSWHVAARSISALPSCEHWYLRVATQEASRFLVTCSTVERGGTYIGDRAKICDNDLAEWLAGLQVGRIASTSVSFVAGAFRIRAGRAAFLRERAQPSTMRATMLLPRASTELVQLNGRSRGQSPLIGDTIAAGNS